MSDRADASRYARELFDVTWRHKQAVDVADELEAVAVATRGLDSHARALFHPLVPKARKIETIRILNKGLGLSRPTAVLLEALTQAYRLYLLPLVAQNFRDRLNKKTGVVQAKVTTAVPLTAQQTDALAARFAEVAGRQVTLSTGVDASIIGGVVTQIDSTIYDGSVTRQLARMREKLVENV
jgi:F-type H+-transporting ATPase subunit delta